jgi:hypothetical protein
MAIITLHKELYMAEFSIPECLKNNSKGITFPSMPTKNPEELFNARNIQKSYCFAKEGPSIRQVDLWRQDSQVLSTPRVASLVELANNGELPLLYANLTSSGTGYLKNSDKKNISMDIYACTEDGHTNNITFITGADVERRITEKKSVLKDAKGQDIPLSPLNNFIAGFSAETFGEYKIEKTGSDYKVSIDIDGNKRTITLSEEKLISAQRLDAINKSKLSTEESIAAGIITANNNKKDPNNKTHYVDGVWQSKDTNNSLKDILNCPAKPVSLNNDDLGSFTPLAMFTPPQPATATQIRLA